MNDSKILFLAVDDIDKDKVLSVFPDAIIKEDNPSEEYIINSYPDIEIICGGHLSKFSKELFEGLSNLKLVVTRSVGFNHIDLDIAHEKGIEICNVPDYGSHVIAEHVFALILSMVRHIAEADVAVENFNYSDKPFRGMALKGKTIGIIGTGKIGEHVARIASMGFLMTVIVFERHKNIDMAQRNHFSFVDSLDELYAKSDIISLHLPLNKSTHHMIDADAFSKMKDGVCFINTARGGIVDSDAILEALKTEKVSYAGLDVLEDEENIEKYAELIGHPNVVTTPHIAYFADDSLNKMYSEANETIKRFINKEKLIHNVN